MLNIYFENVVTHERKHIDPLQTVRIVGGTLFGDQLRLAEYDGGLWRLDGQHYFVVRIDCPTTIHFENAGIRSETHGPYNPAWLVDGAVRAGQSQETALARLNDSSGAWHCYLDQTFWSAIVFECPAEV